MRSLTVKLILSFFIIGIVSLAILVLLARQNTRDEFNRFIVEGRGESLVSELATYYRTNDSWHGVQDAFAPSAQAEGEAPYPSFTIADENGHALFDGGGFQAGEVIPDHELEFAVPILVDGQTVGLLVMEHAPFPGNSREEKFIQRTNQTLLFSALGAGLIALLLGVFLSRTLSRPIRELTRATHAIAQGDLGQQVNARSRDELGELARAFNTMSAELLRSVNARKQMTADIAHELCTPLSLILGHAEAVHDGVLPPTPENFEIIREEATRLEHLVDDLRTLSLADAGELSIQRQKISPARLLEEVATLYRFQTQAKNLALDLDLAAPLPDPSTSLRTSLEADPGRMIQVLTNILDNAVRHTPEGGRITLASSLTPEGAAFSIRDSGPGLPPADLDHIFDRFYRADPSRARDEGGSGLGLAIAKSIVQAHGGTIRAESEPGKGLTVIVTLPVTQD